MTLITATSISVLKILPLPELFGSGVSLAQRLGLRPDGEHWDERLDS
jgi:hypothetical protein